MGNLCWSLHLSISHIHKCSFTVSRLIRGSEASGTYDYTVGRRLVYWQIRIPDLVWKILMPLVQRRKDLSCRCQKRDSVELYLCPSQKSFPLLWWKPFCRKGHPCIVKQVSSEPHSAQTIKTVLDRPVCTFWCPGCQNVSSFVRSNDNITKW